MDKLNVLLIEDDVEVLDVLQEYLKSLGHQVEAFENPLKALQGMESDPNRFSIALVDHHMPGMTGYEFVKKIRQAGNMLPVVLSSGNHHHDLELKGIERIVFVDKPYSLGGLGSLLDRHYRGGIN